MTSIPLATTISLHHHQKKKNLKNPHSTDPIATIIKIGNTPDLFICVRFRSQFSIRPTMIPELLWLIEASGKWAWFLGLRKIKVGLLDWIRFLNTPVSNYPLSRVISIWFYFAGLLLRFSLQHKGKKNMVGMMFCWSVKKNKNKKVGKDLACKDSGLHFFFSFFLRRKKMKRKMRKERSNVKVFRFFCDKRGKKKKSSFLCCLHFSFFLLKKKKKHLWDIYFDEPRSSHWAEIPSQDHFKIRASEPLNRDLSNWAMIRPSQDKIYFKLQSEPPSLWIEIWAIESRY